MMRMRNKATELSSMNGSSAAVAGEWEVRPGGMLVQKRDPDAEMNRIPPPTIRVRVKYGSVYHEVNISSQATFGELKKMLSGATGLHHEDQKVMYKDKERNSKAYLDLVGVKDGSKLVLMEDPISQEKRFLQLRKNSISKSISDISLEVDKLAAQVASVESVICKGGKVEEKRLLNLIELLMNQLLKLDGIMGDGDVKLHRKLQVKRVQKYVEILDVLKIKNSTLSTNNNEPPEKPPSPVLQNQDQKYSNGHGGTALPAHHHHHPPPHSRRTTGFSSTRQPPPSTSRVTVSTQWETFDSTPATLPEPPSTTTAKFNWDLL